MPLGGQIINKIKRLLTQRDFLLALAVGLGIIITGVFLGWYNNKIVPVNPAASAHYVNEPRNPLSFMSNWDGPNYIHIADKGYDDIGNANFFPLYPYFIHLGGIVLGSPLVAALLVSWVCFIGAIYFYIKIIRELYDPKDVNTIVSALIYFILFPTAIFCLATYTESLFAFLALGAIYYTLKRDYVSAALFALFCTASHFTGVFLLALVGMMMLEQKEKIKDVGATMIAGSFGLFGFMYILWLYFRQPLGFITSQTSETHGWLHNSYSHLLVSAGAFNIIFVILLIASVIYWWPRRKSFAVYSALFLLIPLAGKQFGGFDRYVLMAFPLQWMLYERFRNQKPAQTFAAVALGVGWTFFLLRYAGGYIGG